LCPPVEFRASEGILRGESLACRIPRNPAESSSVTWKSNWAPLPAASTFGDLGRLVSRLRMLFLVPARGDKGGALEPEWPE